MYELGRDVAKNKIEAARWNLRAAAQGFADAQCVVGRYYSTGDGLTRSIKNAYFWWTLADLRGYPEAGKYRRAAAAELSAAERSSLQGDAEKWRPRTIDQIYALERTGSTPQAPATRETPPPAKTSLAIITGSGFRVAPDLVVTNHHVVAECKGLTVDGVLAQIAGDDARSDLALLRVANRGALSVVRGRRTELGEPVSVAGYPLRGLLSGLNLTFGSVSSLSGIGGDSRILQITAPVQPGNSGGPVLDSSGIVMGVVVSKLDAVRAFKSTGDVPQNVNFAINSDALRSFLDANRVDYVTSTLIRPIAQTAIANKAGSFTVLIECVR